MARELGWSAPPIWRQEFKEHIYPITNIEYGSEKSPQKTCSLPSVGDAVGIPRHLRVQAGSEGDSECGGVGNTEIRRGRVLRAFDPSEIGLPTRLIQCDDCDFDAFVFLDKEGASFGVNPLVWTG